MLGIFRTTTASSGVLRITYIRNKGVFKKINSLHVIGMTGNGNEVKQFQIQVSPGGFTKLNNILLICVLCLY